MKTWPYSLQRGLFSFGVFVESATIVIASLILAFLGITLFCQVLFRYVLQMPLPWTEEAARHGLVWFAMLASAVAAKRGQHFSFRWGTMLLSLNTRRRLRRLIDVLTIALLGLILMFSVEYLDVVANQNAISTGMDMRIPYFAISAGISLIIFFYVLDLADAWLSTLTNEILSAREKNEMDVIAMLKGTEIPSDHLTS